MSIIKNYNQTECILLLSYLCYAHDGLNGKEIQIFLQTVRNFSNSDEEADNFDSDLYFDDFHNILSANDFIDIADYCLERISSKHYKKVIVHLIEGVVSDGQITELERLIVSDISRKMDIDTDFHNSVVEVMLTKHTNNLTL